MTIHNSCFWSLLSLDSLEFVHIPSSVRKIKIATERDQTTIQDVLLHRSLFEFMHPSEIGMAKNDLSSFLKLKTLAGSVTRCRLLSLKSMACHVLSKNSSLLIQKTPITQMTEDQQLVSPIRIFQIIDSTTLKPLFVWPQLYSFVDMVQSLAKEIALKEFKSPSNEPSPNIAAATEDVSCTRHFYANSKIELFVTKRACEFQRILIPYGNILFESIQVTPLPTVAMTTSLGRPHTASPIYSPSLHLRKFRIQQQQQHPQHDVAGRRRNLSCSSTEKKRRTDAFHGPVTTTTLPENVKTCTRCHTSNSPEWRRGPDGHKT
ncbi:hypothetical protein FB192DRAFT_1280029 [Mucor lusitanicus]|uniref:GATA-type domain-containing protein n=1 Tax=Mucor circinelloides f. lusitanicus TaxID=29924 RepID=A0A8H4F2M2_MUCCL|nr:hypothetical protein FB192DRAFT_1280029 [Mucor lusitanicus]